MGKPLEYLMIHCTATPSGLRGSRQWIEDLHRKNFGWSRVGYRSIIKRPVRWDEPNSKAELLVERLVKANTNDVVETDEITFGAAELNASSHHIALFGGAEMDARARWHAVNNFEPEQFRALRNIIEWYIEHVAGDWKVCGHNQHHNKACPSFWIPTFLEQIGVPESRIYRGDPHGYEAFFRKLDQEEERAEFRSFFQFPI